jgi:hypothetical protein
MASGQVAALCPTTPQYTHFFLLAGFKQVFDICPASPQLKQITCGIGSSKYLLLL